jgi:hypothetical protein
VYLLTSLKEEKREYVDGSGGNNQTLRIGDASNGLACEGYAM